MTNAFRDYADFAPQALKRTPEGYLTGRLRATCSGVFTYRAADGGISHRLRPGVEVGDGDSVASLNSKPVTLLHPGGNVTPGNAKALQVGFTGTDASWDGDYVGVTVTVTDAEAIEAIESGEIGALSCGYEAELVPDSGNWRGTGYDSVMKGIRYNHVALVKAGRAGDGVTFRIGDSADTGIFNQSSGENPGGDTMKTIIIDGVQCQADEAVVAELQKQRDAVTDGRAQLDRVTAERDAALAEVSKLKDSMPGDAEIASRVAAKIALVETARGFGCEVTAADSDDAVRKAVVAKAFDSVNLDGKSGDYVAAMFDAAVASLNKAPAAKKSALEPDLSKVADDADCDPEAAYRKMCNKMKEA